MVFGLGYTSEAQVSPPKATIRGRNWVMKAETADIRNYDFLMTSTGTRCKNKTKANVTYTGCGTVATGAEFGKEDW